MLYNKNQGGPVIMPHRLVVVVVVVGGKGAAGVGAVTLANEKSFSQVLKVISVRTVHCTVRYKHLDAS